MDSSHSSQPKKSASSRSECQFKLYSTFVDPTSLVFDVGANVGNRIQALLWCGARIIAVEPQPDCIQILKETYRSNRQVVIVESAAGRSCGEANLFRARAVDPAASLSEEFITKTRKSGRFAKRKYNKQILVKVLTLDSLIEAYGHPKFIKLDVEGYEENVLSGLSKGTDVLSFEWTPELFEQASACMGRCETLGMPCFQISFYETMRFELPISIHRRTMENMVRSLANNKILFGDIYASKVPLRRGL